MYKLNFSRFYKAVVFITAMFFSGDAFPQNDKLGTWDIVNVEYNFSEKWNAFFENQLRSQKLFDDFFYHELKAGVGYNATDKLSFLLGNGLYKTYTLGGNFKSPVTSSEYRIWQQVVLTNNINRVKLEHRYRIEQRWMSEGFRNRFRYRLNAIVPFNKPEVEAGTIFASVYNELFFTDKDPHFQRNRFFAGLGYEFNNNFVLQLGYLRQYDYAVSGSSSKGFFQTTLLFNIHSSRSDRQQHPSTMD